MTNHYSDLTTMTDGTTLTELEAGRVEARCKVKLQGRRGDEI
ncbi:hypothetical protein ACFO9Q_05695 [Paenibacillus sp. GCM10023252]